MVQRRGRLGKDRLVAILLACVCAALLVINYSKDNQNAAKAPDERSTHRTAAADCKCPTAHSGGGSSSSSIGESPGTLTNRTSVLEETKTEGLTIKEICQPDHAEALAEGLLSNKQSDIIWTSCPQNSWLDKLEELTRRKNAYFFVDIGCNKGYTSSSFFAKWAPELNFSPKTLVDQLPDKHCGYCEDCKDEVTPAPLAQGQPRPGVQVVCVEPNQLAFAQLITVREKFFSDKAKSWAQWHMVNAALGGSDPFVSFPRCIENREECGLGLHNDIVVGHDTVPMYAVDTLLKMFDVPYVDILKMDTEGYDASAIKSAMGSLQSGKIGILYFEYNQGGSWDKTTVGEVVKSLDEGANFVCYFSGKNSEKGSLVRITGCHSGKMEYRHWSNVVCMGRFHPLYPEAERMSSRYHVYQETYYS